MSETRTKNLSNTGTVSRNGAKRGPSHSMEPPRPSKSTRPNGSNVGVRRGVVDNTKHRDVTAGARPQTTRPLSRPVRPTRPNPIVPTVSQGWTGQLVENPPFVALPKPVEALKDEEAHEQATTTSTKRGASRADRNAQEHPTAASTESVEVPTQESVRQDATTAARNPANMCTPEFLRAHPTLAHLYAPEPAATASTQVGNTAPPPNQSQTPSTRTAEPAPQIESLMDNVDETEMGNLSNNFAAMTLTARSVAPAPARQGIMASSHAIAPGSPQSTASVAPSTSTTHSVYVQATSSEAEFWKWKKTQVPRRAGP